MTRIRAITLCFITVFATIAATLCFSLGYDWQTIGFGLNPMLAYPLGCLCFVGIGITWWFLLDDAEDDVIRQHFGIDGEYTIDYIALGQRR